MRDAVRWVVDLGYRHIDTAQAHSNEESVRRALRDGGVPRGEVFLTTKFFPGRKFYLGRRNENAQIFDFDLFNEDMAELDAVDQTDGAGRALERKWW